MVKDITMKRLAQRIGYGWKRTLNGIRRFAENMKSSKKASEINQNNLGATGTKFSSGSIAEEAQKDLNSLTKRYDAYERMYKTDGATAALHAIITLPILSAKYDVKPASEEPEDLEIAAFVKYNLFKGMSNSFNEHLEEAVSCLRHGHSEFEKTFEKRDWIYRDENEKERIIKGMWCIKKLEYRCQRTITKWLFNPDRSFRGFHQKTTDPNGATVDVDLEVPNVLVYTNNKFGDNFEGISIFRPGFKHWKIKDEIYEIDGIGIEKNAIGVAVMQERELRDSQGELVAPVTSDEADEALKIAQSLQAHEEQAFTIRRMWELKDYQGNINTEAIHNSINHHTTMLALSLLADFMLLGSVTATGSWALGDVKKEVLEKSLIKYINVILRVLNKYLIIQLVDANYTTQRYCELVCNGLSEEDLRQWADTMQVLVNSTLLRADKTLRADVREKFDLPVEDEVEEEPAPEAAVTQTFKLLSECNCGGHGHRELTEREKKLGFTDDHRVALKDTLQKAQDAFVLKARPIWEEMKASLVEQLKSGKKASDIEVPEKLKAKYRQNLYDTYMAQEISGAVNVAKELKKPVDEKALKALMEKKAVLVSNALADKDCMDLKYFVRLEEARRLGRK